MGVAATKAFTISDGVTGVYTGQNCGTYLTSAQSVTPNAAFSTAVTPTSGSTNSLTIFTNDTQFMGTTQTVKVQVVNQGFTAADNSGTHYLPTLTFNMKVVIQPCRVYAQSPLITVNGIPTFNYFLFSGTVATPAFVSLQKMFNDRTKICTYDLTYTTAVTPTATGLTLVIDEAALTISLSSSTLSLKDTSQTVTVTTLLLTADSANYAAAGWTYPNKNGFNFIVNIKCTVVALAFAAGPVDITSTELRANVASDAFTATETPISTSCGYTITYSYSILPSSTWVTFSASTNKFTILSLTVLPTGVTQTATLTVTATVTLPAGYIGTSPVTVSKSITATLLPCTVDSVQPVTTPSLNIAYTLQSGTPTVVSSSSFTYSEVPACGYPITVTKTDPTVSPLSSSSVATLTGTSPYQLAIQTSNVADSGTHTIVVSANVDLSKQTASYSTTALNFILAVSSCVPSYSFVATPVDIMSTELRTDVTSLSFQAVETTSCGYPFTYSYSTLPSWVTYDSGTQTFKIVSSTVAPTGADQTNTITMTATITVPAGYVGSLPAPLLKSITAKLLACTVDSVWPVINPSLNLAYTLKESSITPTTVSSATFTFTQTPACGYPITVAKTDSFLSSSAATITGFYQLDISTNSYSDEGIHTIVVTANVDSSKRSGSYTSTPLTFLVTVTFCQPSFTLPTATMPEDTTYIVQPTLTAVITTQSISVVDANSCGFDSLLITNSLKKTDGSVAPTWTSLTLNTIPSTISIGTNDVTQIATYLIKIIGSGKLPDAAHTPIGFTSGTWTLILKSACELSTNAFVSQNPTVMNVSALSNTPGQSQQLTEYIDNYGQSIGNNAFCGLRTYNAQYLDNGNNVWMGTNTGSWISLPAGFPLQFDPTLMKFTLISNAANQVTTLGAVNVRLNVGFANFNQPTLVDQFSFTITKCVVTSLTQNNVSSYTPAMINYTIGITPITALQLTHTWTQTPNCLYPFTYKYTATACPATNATPCTPGNTLGFLRTMSFATTDAEGVNVRSAAPTTYTETTNQLFTNDMTQLGLYSVQITATLADDPNVISASISSQMNLVNICMITVLNKAFFPETVQLFVGEQSLFSFNELTNTQNVLYPVPDCGELNILAQFNGVTVNWITVNNTGQHAQGNKVYFVLVDGSLLTEEKSGPLTIKANLVSYPNVKTELTTALTVYKLIFGQMLAVQYKTNDPEIARSFDYSLLPKEPLPIFQTDAFITAKGGVTVTPPFLPSNSFKIGYAMPSFTFFNKEVGSVNAGNYTITYQIRFTNFPRQTQIRTFPLEIIAPLVKVVASSNTPPYFIQPNDWPYFLVLTCGNSWKYQIPQITDDNPNDSGTLKFVTLGQADTFMTFDDTKLEFSVEDGFITSKQNGEYKLSAYLVDLNGGQSDYNIDLIVFCNDFNATKHNGTFWSPFKSSEKPPLPFIIRISSTGRVSVKFTEALVLFNATNITNGTVFINDIERPFLEVKVVPFDKNKIVNFTWECLNFTTEGMELQLYFQKPARVSYEIPFDNLNLTFWGQPAFKALTRIDYVPYAYNISYPIPAQLNPTAGAFLENVLTHASLEKKMSMFGSFLTQVLISGALQPILEMIGKSQIIVHMNLVNISIPASATIYYSYLFSIISFNLLPTDDYFDAWFQLPQQDPITTNFGLLGYETTFFLRNLGQVSFYLLLWPLQIVCAYILGKIKHRKAIKWSRSWKKKLIWRGILSYIEGQTMIISVSFLLAVVYQTTSDWKYVGQLANIVLAILVGGVVIVYPFFQIIKLHTLFPKIQRGNPFIKQRWGFMFETLHIPLKSSKLKHLDDGKSTLYYEFYMRLRQIGMAICVCTLINQPMLCLFYFNFSALFALILAGMIRPYSLPEENTSEMLNEFGLLVLNYHMLCLTDFVGDPDTRETIGLSLCGTTTVILLCNIVVIFIDLYSKFAKRLKLWLVRRQFAKNQEEKRKMLLLLSRQYVSHLADRYVEIVYGKKLNSPTNKKKPLGLKRLANPTYPKKSEVLRESLEVIQEVESVQSSDQRRPPVDKKAEMTLTIDQRLKAIKDPQKQKMDFSFKDPVSDQERQPKPKLIQAKLRLFDYIPTSKVTEFPLPQMTSNQYSEMILLEKRISKMRRLTEDEEEHYWSERQKLSVMKASFAPYAAKTSK